MTLVWMGAAVAAFIALCALTAGDDIDGYD